MSTPKLPSCRNLDIYRLVTLRRRKQLDVARSFGVSPVRVCQIVAHVHQWVAESLPKWFFTGRDELRFQAALAYEKIRLMELPADPETVILIGPGWTYKRENHVASLTNWQPFDAPARSEESTPTRRASEDPSPSIPIPARRATEGDDLSIPPTPPASALSPSPPSVNPHTHSHVDPELSPHPLNSMHPSAISQIAANPAPTSNSYPPDVLEIAHRFAEILILWKKTKRHASPPSTR